MNVTTDTAATARVTVIVYIPSVDDVADSTLTAPTDSAYCGDDVHVDVDVPAFIAHDTDPDVYDGDMPHVVT